MNILLICMIPLSFMLGGFLTYKGIQTGLTFKQQIENKEIPKMNNPIIEIKRTNEEIKQQKYAQEQIKEWLGGE